MRLKLCCGCAISFLSIGLLEGERKKQTPKIRFTFGQPFGQEHVNGRTAGRPAEGSRSEMVAISVQIFQAIEEYVNRAGNGKKLRQVRVFFGGRSGEVGFFVFYLFSPSGRGNGMIC